MLETSARLLRLLSLLQTHREWSGAELAERLGVSTRTVRRDVDRLRALGYPVVATQGIAGYQLAAGAAMPPLLLDDDEAIAVAVGLRSGAGGTVTGIAETSLRALAKLEQVLPSRLRHRVSALSRSTVRVDAPSPAVDADHLLAIAEATRRHERLRFDYVSHNGTESARDVEPLTLVSWGRHWYLVAWDTARDDWRTFRVDRLVPHRVTGPAFPPRDPPEGGVTAYVAQQLSLGAWPWQTSVTLHESADTMTARVWPGLGVLEAVDAHTCLFHMGADSPHSLAWMILALGTDFDVDGPPELVDSLRNMRDRSSRALRRH
jgi:predicted DNA-binding transcriptional regulator YafY